ncbi:rapid alkalinization factor 23-like [Amaranthus tricolor]|uniref:rapid alkalinization factor 23-like n=1 Tax=Amaranthus tricolor TaxID=29722 RepID=UPI00258D0597|nr:rapid alkalinization factor 23-like [Amaranthus tricolor]
MGNKNLSFFLPLLLTISLFLTMTSSLEDSNEYAMSLGINQRRVLLVDSDSLDILDSILSYAMLDKNKVPCENSGQSYYSCNPNATEPANPYQRGCTTLARCYRS